MQRGEVVRDGEHHDDIDEEAKKAEDQRDDGTGHPPHLPRPGPRAKPRP